MDEQLQRDIEEFKRYQAEKRAEFRRQLARAGIVTRDGEDAERVARRLVRMQ